MKYEIKTFIMRFKPGDVLSGEELIKEGIDANKWVKEGLIIALPDKPLSQEEKKMDLNNDGKLDEKDSKIASSVLNAFKSKKNKK